MTDRDVDLRTGDGDMCYMHRLYNGVLPNFTFPLPSFSLENQELGTVLATDRHGRRHQGGGRVPTVRK